MDLEKLGRNADDEQSRRLVWGLALSGLIAMIPRTGIVSENASHQLFTYIPLPSSHFLFHSFTNTKQVDYRSFLDKEWEAMPAEEFVAMASDPKVLGNPLLKTQHFIGGTRWEKVSDVEIIGWHQLRVPHQKYKDASMTEVAVKGHAHSTNKHWYKKVNGEWKFAGLSPEIRWSEFDFDRVFEEGRGEFGEAAAEQAAEEAVVGVSKDQVTVETKAIPVM